MSVGNGALPPGWRRAPLREVCLPVDKVDPKERPDAELSYIDISSIDRAAKRIVEAKRLTGAEAPSRARQLVRSDDVLFSTVRPNLQTVAPVPPELDGEVASTGFCVLRPGPTVHPKYLFWSVLEPGFATRVLEKARGVSYPAVRDRDVLEETVPLPRFEEQARIVAELERLLDVIATGASDLARARGQLQVFRRAVLHDALGECYRPTAQSERLPDLPDGWEWSTVASEGVPQLGRMLNKERSSGPNMHPYLRVANVLDDRLDLSDVKQMDFPPDEYERYRLEPGDILLNEGQTPELLGRAAMYRGEMPGVCFQKTLLRFRAGERLRPEFALLVFRHYLYSGRFRQESRITTGIAHLTLERFVAMELPVPPLKTQDAIVRSVRPQLTSADEFESSLLTREDDADLLRAALLRDAFSGVLLTSSFKGEPDAGVGRQSPSIAKTHASVPVGR